MVIIHNVCTPNKTVAAQKGFRCADAAQSGAGPWHHRCFTGVGNLGVPLLRGAFVVGRPPERVDDPDRNGAGKRTPHDRGKIIRLVLCSV